MKNILSKIKTTVTDYETLDPKLNKPETVSAQRGADVNDAKSEKPQVPQKPFGLYHYSKAAEYSGNTTATDNTTEGQSLFFVCIFIRKNRL